GWDSLSLDSKLNLVFVWLGITRGGVYAARSWGQSPGAPERQVARQHRWNLRRPHADLMWPNPTGLNVNPAPVPRVGLSAAATKATVACAVSCPPMSLRKTIFMQMFGRPRGALGRVGGVIMAHANAECGAWVTALLKVEAKDSVLEVGFGPGVIIERLSKIPSVGRIA